MLVLSRKEKEVIKAKIPVAKLRELLEAAEARGTTTLDLIAVTVVKIRGNLVRLGCEALPEIDLIRGELGPVTAEAVEDKEAREAWEHRHQ